MASLKEVKARIASVNSTLKITSAMKMVASAKLHRAQAAIENMLPYERKLHEILEGFLSSEGAVASAYAEKHDAVERVAVVAVSSNRSLGKERVLVFPIGKKIAEAVRKAGYVPQGDYQSLAERPTYREASQLAERLMRMYAEREIDRVELVYNHFKSTASQVLRREEYLPLQVEPAKTKGVAADYIVEPSREEVIRTLVPQVLSLKIFTMLLDSNAAEHAARTIAMQMATDNATELLQELTVQYNKSRQQMITSELLDMMGAEIGNG